MASPRPSRLFLLLITNLSLALALLPDEHVVGVGGGMILVGGRKDIKNVEKNKEVQDLGRFAVKQFNRNSRGSSDELVFAGVLEAQSQVVAGMKYYLKLAVTSGSDVARETYYAVVVVVPRKLKKKKKGMSRELTYFGPSPP